MSAETTGGFTATSAADWVDPNPVQEVTLPSGNRARIKKPNLYILGRTGQVPAKVKKARDRQAEREAEPQELSVAEVAERSADIELFVDWVLTRSFIEPKLVAGPANGAVSVDMLTADDKAFVIERLGIEV